MKKTIKKGTCIELSTKDKELIITALEDSTVKITSLNPKKIILNAKNNSKIEIFTIHNNNFSIIKEGNCEQNANIEWNDAIFNCKSLSVKTNLNKPNAKTKHQGFFFSNKKQNFNINIESIHKSKNTESFIHHKGILNDYSSVNCNGKIFIGKNCKNSIAHQKFENLLLSNTAVSQANPILEVLNNNVSCSHGATMTHIDEEKIFYALSRAISEKAAKKLIVNGFIQQFIDNFPFNEILIKEIEEKVK